MSSSSGKGTIILVDDDARMRKMYSDFLQAVGYTVLTAADGTEAMSLMLRVQPKLVLLDIMMPGMTGIETCRRLRQNESNKMPILFLTSLDEAEHLKEGIAAGGDDYILKTSPLEKVLERIQHWSSWKQRGKAHDRRGKVLDDVTAFLEDGSPAPAKPVTVPSPQPASPKAALKEMPAENDATAAAINTFVGKALKTVDTEFGHTREQLLYFLGYVAGIVDHDLREGGTLKPGFQKYIRSSMRNSGIVSEYQINELLGALDKLSTDKIVRQGWQAGHHDRAASASNGPDFVPQGLHEFKPAA
jgi:CheY-like chemotaxis protein